MIPALVAPHRERLIQGGSGFHFRSNAATTTMWWETAHLRQKANAWLHYTTNLHLILFDETGQVVYIVWTGESAIQSHTLLVAYHREILEGMERNFAGKKDARRKTPPCL